MLKYFALLLLLLCGPGLLGCNGRNRENIRPGFMLFFSPTYRLADDAPWPMWQHDPSHTGRSPYNGPVSVSTPAAAIDLCCFGIFGSPVLNKYSNAYIGSIRSEGDTLTCDFFQYPTVGASGLLHGLDSGASPLAGFPYDSNRGSVMTTAIECAPLLLDDGSIVFGKDDGYMYRVGAGGGLIWEAPADDPFNPALPTDDNEQMIPSPLPGSGTTVYFLSHFADVYGPGPVANAVAAVCPDLDPFPFNGTATQWYSKLYALDVRDGTRQWVFDPATDPASGGLPMVGWGSPALGADGSCIIGLMHTAKPTDHYVPTTGRVFAIGPEGTRRWVFPAGIDPMNYTIWTSPVISPSGNIYIGASKYDYASGAILFSLTPEGTLRWYYEFTENTIAASPALRSDGTIIVATQNRDLSDANQLYGRIYALTDNGTEAVLLWRYPAVDDVPDTVPCGFYSSPLVDQAGRVYIGNEPFPYQLGVNAGKPKYLLGLDLDGSLLFRQPLAGFVHGNLALGSDGTLYVPLWQPPRLLLFVGE